MSVNQVGSFCLDSTLDAQPSLLSTLKANHHESLAIEHQSWNHISSVFYRNLDREPGDRTIPAEKSMHRNSKAPQHEKTFFIAGGVKPDSESKHMYRTCRRIYVQNNERGLNQYYSS